MAPLSRRHLLGGGALAGLAWLGVTLWGHRAMPDAASPCLGAAARTTLTAALEVFLPSADLAPSVAEGVDRFLAGGDPYAPAQLRLALGVLEHLGGRGVVPHTRFSRLSLQDRAAVLSAWERSGWSLKRQIFQALRRLSAFSWYADPRSWDHIGYDGPWVKP